MKRREFIALVGGAAACPLVARAQQSDPMRRIAVLMGYAESDPQARLRMAALERGLAQLGWIDGRNIRIDLRWGAAEPNRIRELARALVRLKPELIVANTATVLRILREEAGEIPIIFVLLNDPVGSGFVPSLAQPAGNLTGFSAFENEYSAKWLELLRDIAQELSRVLVVQHVQIANRAAYLPAIERLAGTWKVTVDNPDLTSVGGMENAIRSFGQKPDGGLIVFPGAFTAVNRTAIIRLAAELRLPAVYPFRYYVVDGGLLSYGVDTEDVFRRSASYVDRILNGASPGELPVQQPTKFELVINIQTAKALGLTVPVSLIARADEVIE
jgi:putative ABC transport system substrate-binding protein